MQPPAALAVAVSLLAAACAPSRPPALEPGPVSGTFVFAAADGDRIDYRKLDGGCAVEEETYPDHAVEEMLDSVRIVLLGGAHYESALVHRYRCLAENGQATGWMRSTALVGGRVEAGRPGGEVVLHASRDPAEPAPFYVGRFVGGELQLTRPFAITLSPVPGGR